jgi:cell division protein ZapA (FtsZ GTPase activity inhibitor)
MPNHVTITVGGTKYNVIADDPPEYVTELAEYFDKQFTDISKSSRIPALTAAILAGITVTDEYFKSRNSVDSLVNQIKEYVSETTRMRSEIGELRRELERTKVELARYRGKA